MKRRHRAQNLFLVGAQRAAFHLFDDDIEVFALDGLTFGRSFGCWRRSLPCSRGTTFPARDLERLRVGGGAKLITYVLVDVPGDFTGGRRRIGT
jgi:hypothetical protein